MCFGGCPLDYVPTLSHIFPQSSRTLYSTAEGLGHRLALVSDSQSGSASAITSGWAWAMP